MNDFNLIKLLVSHFFVRSSSQPLKVCKIKKHFQERKNRRKVDGDNSSQQIGGKDD